MKRAEKVARIQEVLDRLVPDPQVPLEHDDPFTLLIAVLLSAQTTDERVNMVTPGLFALGRTPQELARRSEAEVLERIRSVGLAPSKAKAIVGLSRILVAEHGGRVPREMAALERLPGVGHKTASVVVAQAFGEPTFPVDTHIHRLAARWGLSSGKNVVQTERDLKRAFPRESWNRVHLQIILFGRRYCPALRHDMSTCPICSFAASARARASAKPRRATSGAAKSEP